MSCAFCSLLMDHAPVDWIAREEHAAALLPLPASSLAPGHTLVIPTVHVSGVHEAGALSLAATMVLVQKVSVAMRDALGAPGVNLLSASGPGSEQSVAHLHFHVVPRWRDDGFTTWPSQRSRKTIAESPVQLLADAIHTSDARARGEHPR
ncbi:HIT domain-containing protein [Arthrobacter sp. NPDC092385]|uniref:HIT domain-containing protein n=1 Tax=Arthrobacter sp. NPDC092385 TaxID=3363943 RepID=UPI0037FA0C74